VRTSEPSDICQESGRLSPPRILAPGRPTSHQFRGGWREAVRLRSSARVGHIELASNLQQHQVFGSGPNRGRKDVRPMIVDEVPRIAHDHRHFAHIRRVLTGVGERANAADEDVSGAGTRLQPQAAHLSDAIVRAGARLARRFVSAAAGIAAPNDLVAACPSDEARTVASMLILPKHQSAWRVDVGSLDA
jgi:hypothetical protein